MTINGFSVLRIIRCKSIFFMNLQQNASTNFDVNFGGSFERIANIRMGPNEVYQMSFSRVAQIITAPKQNPGPTYWIYTKIKRSLEVTKVDDYI